MALPPFSFTSFSTVPPPPPPPPPSESSKQPAVPPEPTATVAPAQEPIMPPTQPPTSVPEVPPAAPPVPAQNVTVVVTPRAEPPGSSHRWKWVRTGAILGLIAGLAAGYHVHSRQPAEFESAAKLQVAGPAPAGDADAQVSTLRSDAVIGRAAARLDDLRPFEMPPPRADAARMAFLRDRLAVAPGAAGSGAGSAVVLTFRAPDPADAPKYLLAVIDAYRAELASRPVPAPKSAPAPAAPPKPAPEPTADPTPAAALAEIDAKQQELTRKLADLTPDDAATIETRLATSRTAAVEAHTRLKRIEADLALIRTTGSARKDRLVTLEKLGVKVDLPEPSVTPADLKAAEATLRDLESRKAELGLRLGPEHRDMLALAEQIKLVKERIAKAMPPAPKGPDELDQYRAKLEAERKGLTEKTKTLAAAVAKDETLLGEVAAIRKELLALGAARRAQEDRVATRPPTAPGTPPTPAPAPPLPAGAYTVQVVTPPTAGERVTPPIQHSLLPGGLIGLVAGGLLGLLTSFLMGAATTRPRPKLRPIPAVRSSRAAGSTAAPGPRLSVPVFAQVPEIRADAPAEKRSVEGLSPLLVGFGRPNSPEAEAFRAARRELTAATQGRGHQAIAVTSPGPGDGKSVVAANLAISLAQAGKRVVLVDCDLRTPKVQELFKLGRLGDSLKSIMAAEADLRMAVRSCEVGNLFLLPAGRGPMDPLDLLARPKFRELVAELKSQYEYVILDSPPTLAEKELAVLAPTTDGAVLVVRPGSDIRSRADRAQGDLIEAGTRVLGAVVNTAPDLPLAEELPEAPPEAAQPVAPGAMKQLS